MNTDEKLDLLKKAGLDSLLTQRWHYTHEEEMDLVWKAIAKLSKHIQAVDESQGAFYSRWSGELSDLRNSKLTTMDRVDKELDRIRESLKNKSNKLFRRGH